MGTPGRKGNAKQRYRAEVELISKYGNLSSREMADKLYEEYGIKVSHGQVNIDLKRDIEALSEDKLKNKKTGLLNELDEMIQAALEISRHDELSSNRLKAMDTYRKLVESKAKILKVFEEVRLQAREQERPVYKISIGKPEILKGEDKNSRREE